MNLSDAQIAIILHVALIVLQALIAIIQYFINLGQHQLRSEIRLIQQKLIGAEQLPPKA